ncbi:hypothetical protein PR246_03360, partial [Metamycoplasma hyosynoviae]
DDEKSTAIFSYQIKVKSIDDDKFTSNVLEIKFDDFAKTSTQLTQYLNELTFSYENASSVFPQDAIQTKVIAKNKGVNLPSNYELIFTEFKTEGEYPKKIDAIVKLRDNANNIISDSKSIEITGFKNYLTPEELNAYIEKIQLDVNDKNTKFISDINNYSEIIKSNFEDDEYEIDLSTFLIEKLSDLVSIKVHFRIKEKDGKPGIYSKQVSKTITGFKMPQELIENLAQKVKFDVTNKSTKMAYDFWDKFDEIEKTDIDSRISIVNTPSVKQTDANKITITYKVKDNRDNRESKTYSKVIEGFNTSSENESAYSYEIIEYEGNKAAYLNARKDLNSFIVPAKIGNYKVIKVGNLFTNVLRTAERTIYGVVLEEGIVEVNNLVVNTEDRQYAQIAAISLPKTIKKITNLISGISTYFANLKMYDNVEEINGLFNEYVNKFGKSDLYQLKLPGDNESIYTFWFETRTHFKEFFDVETSDSGRMGHGSFKLQLQVSGETPKLKTNLGYKENYTFLESADNKTLYKAFTNKEADVEKFESKLGYEIIAKSAFSYLGVKEFNLWAPSINMQKFNWFLFEKLPNIKKIKFQEIYMEDLNLNWLFDGLELDELTLPDFKDDDGANILKRTNSGVLNVSTKKIKLPKNVKDIHKFMSSFSKVENLTELTKLESIRNRAFESAGTFETNVLDFTNSPLKHIEYMAFWRNFENITLHLPKGINYMGKFIMFVAEKNNNYNYMGSDDESLNNQVILDKFKNCKIIIKESKRPSTWSKYFMGQYSSQSDTATGKVGELEIQWKG